MPINPIGGGESVTAPSVARIEDGITTNLATVAQFHNADNQQPGGTAFGILTGGVAQLLNILGNLDRQRETGIDGIPAVGVSSGSAQFAMQFLTTDSTDNFAPGTRTFTPVAMSGTINGVAWSIQLGTVLSLDSSTNQENVVVSAVAATTFTCVTTKTHNGTGTPFIISGFVYNQERDASGENDGATGSGTAVAAEYEFNGNVQANGSTLSGKNFDRSRNLNGKGLAAGGINNNPLAANSTSLTLNSAPTTLQAGQKILFDRAGANPETNYVGLNYTFGSTTVPLQVATQFSHAQNATVEWDQHAPLGPGLNGFLPDGVGIEEEALWDPVSQKFYLERSATQDGVSGQNVVMENPGLYNGATIDRGRSGSAANLAATSGIGSELTTTPGQWSITNAATTGAQATVTKAAGGAGVRHIATSLSVTLASGSTAMTVPATPVQVQILDGAAVLWTSYISIPATAGGMANISLSGLNLVGTAATAMTIAFTAGGGANSFESVTLTGYDVS